MHAMYGCVTLRKEPIFTAFFRGEIYYESQGKIIEEKDLHLSSHGNCSAFVLVCFDIPSSYFSPRNAS